MGACALGYGFMVGQLPEGVTVSLTGMSDQLEATRASLGSNLWIAVALCYLQLVISYRQLGVSLLLTVPLGAIVIFGLAFTALITLTFLPALLGLWRSKFYEHAAFYGGTALRIFHGLRRFSEDLNFSLLEPDADFDLAPHLEAIRSELAGFGFTFEVEQKIKQIETPIESAFIKGSTSINLLEIGVPPGLPERFSTTQKLKIKLEVGTDPPAGADTRRVTLSARCGRTCAVERGLLCGAAEPDEGERGVRCFAFCFDADKSVCIAGRVNTAASSRSYSLCGHQLWRLFR